jgi:hypothetical protein
MFQRTLNRLGRLSMALLLSSLGPRGKEAALADRRWTTAAGEPAWAEPRNDRSDVRIGRTAPSPFCSARALGPNDDARKELCS